MSSEGGDHPETNAYKPCTHCKAQRLRNCGPACKMAPYFPAEKLRDFKNAQRLFGVRSIKKMIDEVEEGEERQAAADSILFEGNARRAHPSLGSYDILLEQRKEFAASIRELEAVRKLVNDCKKMAGDLSPEQRVKALLLANGLSGRGQ